MDKNKKIIFGLLIWLLASTGLVTFFVWSDPLKRAAIEMLWSLIFFWVIIGGTLIYIFRNLFIKFYSKLQWPFWLKFTVFSTLFFLIEEAIAVAINNYFLPWTHGQVQLTASTNYWEVVSKHSVVIFIPIFLILSFFVKKYKWSPFRTFIIFGIIGTFAEASIGGLLGLLEFGLWIFVYGLMVYLPAHFD